MVRKRFALLGGVFGIGYTMFAMTASYSMVTQVDKLWEVSYWRVLMEFCVFCLFTIPLGAMIGVGIGFLVEGAIGLICGKPKRPASTPTGPVEGV